MKFDTGDNMNDFQNHYIKWKKPDTKDGMWCFWKRENSIGDDSLGLGTGDGIDSI